MLPRLALIEWQRYTRHMSAPRTVFIVNPAAQNGALGRRWPEITHIIRREVESFEEQFTEFPGQASQLARQAIDDGVLRIIAVGGDGTLNEVVNGFIENNQAIHTNCALGLLPFGTGGDFRKSVRIPKDVTKAAQVIAAGRTRAIDVGILDYSDSSSAALTHSRAFINIASFGLSGKVDEMVNQGSKRLGGRIAFLVATARAGLRYQSQPVRLTFDDDKQSIEMVVSTVAIANGRFFGGGMRMAPEAELDDGFFDVVAVGDMSVTDFLFRGHRLYRGTHLSMDKVSSRRAKTVMAEPLGDEPVLIDVDGENPGRLPARFQILESAINFLIP